MDPATRVSIGALIGSLRVGSYNRRLFETLVDLAPDTVDLYEIPIRLLPHFDEDLDDAPPPEVRTFRDAVAASTGILFVSPEYNYSIPGVLKNAIDWASWPPGSAALYGKPAAIIGASIGRSGTMRGQLHLRQVLPYCNVHLMNKPEVFLPFAADRFPGDGTPIDAPTIASLRQFIESLEAWVRFMTIEARIIR